MLVPLDEDLWTATAPFTVGGLQIGVRSNVVRLPGGGLLVHSPIACSRELRAALDALGPVRFLVAPNKVHHLFLAEWVEAYPTAKLLGPVGLPDKRRDLRFDGVLVDARPDPAWGGALEPIQFYGAPYVNEVAFLHRPSRTLLLTDLAFHVCGPVNWRTRLFLRYGRCHGRLKTTLSMRLCVRDRAAARASRERLLALDFARICVAHGDVVEHGGREALREALAWLGA